VSSFNSDLHKAVTEIVDALPQRSLISDSTAARWIEEVIKLEGERAIWHAHRAATIGGSEAGEFLLAAMNERPAYNSLEEIWEQKMLLRLPDRPNIYMRRGTAMEDLARRVFLKLTGHKSILDSDEIKEAFSKPHAIFPHMGGNTDEVVDASGYRVVTDFKVRNKLDEEKGVSVVNGAQLHWYGLIHEANTPAKKRPDGYCLAELDIPADMIDDLMANPPTTDEGWDRIAEDIAAINRPGFGMKTQYFKHNEMLANNLVRLTKQWWDKYVMTGTPYQKPKPQKPSEMTDIDRKKVQDAQNRYAIHKIAENASKESATEARNEIDAIRAKYEIKEWPFSSQGLSASVTKKFDKERAAKALEAKGVDRAALCKASDVPDVDRMVQTLVAHDLLGDMHYKPSLDTRAIKKHLKEQDISASKFEDNAFRIGLSRAKEDLPVRELLEKKMTTHIDQFMSEAAESQPRESTVEAPVDELDLDAESYGEQAGLKLA